jgi:hypothetical protein
VEHTDVHPNYLDRLAAPADQLKNDLGLAGGHELGLAQRLWKGWPHGLDRPLHGGRVESFPSGRPWHAGLRHTGHDRDADGVSGT